MIQHHFCLYCHNKLHDYYACTCEESKLKWYVTKPEPIMKEIAPLIKQDLLYTAHQLPEINNIDHEKLLIDSYREGGWCAVERYVSFVYALYKELNPKESRVEKINRLGDECTSLVRSLLIKAINRLKQLILKWKTGEYYKKQ